MVEWIFAFETRRIVSRSKIDNVVDDIAKLLEYAKGFPQEHLSGGSTVTKSHCGEQKAQSGENALLREVGLPAYDPSDGLAN